MTIATLLSILASSTGFMSACFFAYGAVTLSPAKIFDTSSTYWDFNRPWGDSIAVQRADYIVGALLLLASFAAQLLSSLIPSGAQQSLPRPYDSAIAGTLLVLLPLTFFLALAVLLRKKIAKSTMQEVHKLQQNLLAQQTLSPSTPPKD